MSAQSNNYYVYTIFDNLDEPFYVGKGSGDRYKKTLKRGSDFKLNKIKKDGGNVKILCDNLTEESSFKIEKCLIRLLGRRDLGTGCLVNHTEGGESPSNFSENTLNKMRLSHIGKKPSKETLVKLSNIRKDILKSEEHKEKIRNSLCKNTYKFNNIDGREIITKNYNEFCKQHNLSIGNISSILHGKRKSHKGWKVSVV